MTRGYSLEQDLRFLINNSKYSDIEILCEDEKKFYCCRAILAARSEVFDRLLYNGMKESYENQISLPNINSIGMEIVLEYIYTGSIKEDCLSKDNTVEVFYAADYFQLPGLQDFIMKTIKNKINFIPEILSKISEKMLLVDDIFLNLLVEEVAITPLNTIEFGRLSIAGLQYLLSYTHEREIPFATSEYEVFRYSTILAAKQVSNDAYNTLIERLPTLEQMKEMENSIQFNINITDYQKVVKELEPLIKFIDFGRIEERILTNIIEPLEIHPVKIILDAYQQEVNLNDIRGIPINYVWDETACGTELIIEGNGKVVRALRGDQRSVRAKMVLENKFIFEWDIIIEKICRYAWVGVCASENFNYNYFAGYQSTGWILGSNGLCWNSNRGLEYCSPFKVGTKITVHLDMNKRTCAFTINNIKYPEVLKWNNLPSKLYPMVSLCYPGQLRIQPHQK